LIYVFPFLFITSTLKHQHDMKKSKEYIVILNGHSPMYRSMRLIKWFKSLYFYLHSEPLSTDEPNSSTYKSTKTHY